MSKPVLFAALLLLAALTGAAFGAAHNQLSYAVGSDYFHAIRFPQAGFAPDINGRWGAARLGITSGAWLALLLAIPVFGIGLAILPQRRFAIVGVFAMIVALIWTLTGTMLGLASAMVLPDMAATILPDAQRQSASILRAAMMHQGAFFGAAIGVLAAFFTVWRCRPKRRRTPVSVPRPTRDAPTEPPA